MYSPGDVVLVDFPGAQGIKTRPGIVVSSATYHVVRPDVVVAICTSNIAAAKTVTDYVLQDWASAGLRKPSAYRSYFEMFIVRDIQRLLGHLSDRDWADVQARLRLAIAVA